MLPFYHFTVYHIGPITLQVWGTFVALGIGLALFLGFRESQRRGLSGDTFLSLGLWATVAAIVGARIFYVLLFLHDFTSNFWDVFRIWNGGMVAYGGVIGAVLAIFWYARTRKLDFLAYLDVVALVFPAGYAVGRIGCHLIRDHMGKLTSVPWGFVVNPGEVRHDTAVYSILSGLVLFAVFWPQRKKPRFKGFYVLWVALLYAVARFFIDALRATDLPGSDPRFFHLTISQYVSLLAVAMCASLLIRQRFAQKKQKRA